MLVRPSDEPSDTFQLSLQAAGRAYHTLLDRLPVAILIRDSSGRLVFVNQEAEAVFGYSRTELVGAPVDVLVPERFRGRQQQFRLAFREQPTHRTAGPDTALPGRRKDGTEFPVDVSLSPIRLGGQQFVVDVIHDATPNQQIFQEAATLHNALVQSLLQALSTVHGTLDLLQRLLAGGFVPTAEELTEALESIATTTAGALGLGTELIDILQSGSGRLPIQACRPVDLVALVRQEVRLLQAAGEQRLVVQTPATGLHMEGDPARLSRVLAHLLANAVAYSPTAGPIHVSLTAQDEDRRRWAVFEVADQGLGIPASDLPHIFERFYRGSNVRGQRSGSGLGLFVVQQTVALHGGEIHVDSAEGRGTTATVRLPLD
jgi:protein-histidine pros-kinase